ncbi:MAG: ABC-2 transporter permease [Acutalibacteraceae bacterium]
MTAKLLKKEFSLAMHPITPLMLLLSAMVLIPNYPYIVMFFYLTLGIFFTCLLGRENNDINYTLLLTLSKRETVKARMFFCCILELIQLVLTIPFIFFSQQINAAGNAAGMDANLALLGEGFVCFGVFNFVFFVSYYKNVNKVGISFIKSCIPLLLLTVADIISTYTLPFVRDKLDTPDSSYLASKLIFVLGGAILYVVLTAAAFYKASKNFEKQDIS